MSPHMFIPILTIVIATSNRSAFSRRDPVRLLVNAPPPPSYSTIETTETQSTSLQTAETESTSISSEGKQAESSRMRERFQTPDQFTYANLTTQPDPEADVDELHEEILPEGVTPASTATYFICIHCSITRGTGLRYSDICVYCLEHEQKYCIAGDHEADRDLFTDMEGTEQSSCRDCRGRE